MIPFAGRSATRRNQDRTIAHRLEKLERNQKWFGIPVGIVFLHSLGLPTEKLYQLAIDHVLGVIALLWRP